jgi:hypothetical protein
MKQTLKADDGISIDAHQTARDRCARTQYLSEQPGGLLRKSMDIDLDLSAMSNESVLIMTTLLLEGLSWSKVHRFLLKHKVEHLGDRRFCRTQKVFVPSPFQPAEADCYQDFKYRG